MEEWSDDKLIASIQKTGVSTDDAQEIANKVKDWVKANTKNNIIDSVQIRDKVVELLKVNFPAEADSYQAFKK